MSQKKLKEWKEKPLPELSWNIPASERGSLPRSRTRRWRVPPSVAEAGEDSRTRTGTDDRLRWSRPKIRSEFSTRWSGGGARPAPDPGSWNLWPSWSLPALPDSVRCKNASGLRRQIASTVPEGRLWISGSDVFWRRSRSFRRRHAKLWSRCRWCNRLWLRWSAKKKNLFLREGILFADV